MLKSRLECYLPQSRCSRKGESVCLGNEVISVEDIRGPLSPPLLLLLIYMTQRSVGGGGGESPRLAAHNVGPDKLSRLTS